MKLDLKRFWCQISWLWFLPLCLLILGVSWQIFIKSLYHSPAELVFARVSAVILVSIAVGALILRGCLLAISTALAALTLFLIPFLNPETLSTILVSTWMGISAILIGDRLIHRIAENQSLPALDHLALSLAIGMAVLMLVSTFLGFARLYYPIIAWFILSIPIIFLLPPRIRQFRERIPRLRKSLSQIPDTRLLAWGTAAILVCGTGAYLWALAPAVRYDSLSYHVPVPLHYIRSHAITELPEIIQSYWAHYAETLYTLGMLINPSTAIPGVLHFQAGILTALFTYIIGRKLGGKNQGIIAALLFWTLPIVQVETGSAYVELFTAAFIMAAVYAVWTWVEGASSHWLILTGLFCGIAIGVKITAFLPTMLIGAFVAGQLIHQRKPKREIIRLGLLFGLTALFIAAPWLVRDWVWTGNPVFPSLNTVFQSPVSTGTISIEFQPTSNKLAQIIKLPILLLFRSKRYYHEMPGFAFGGLSFLCHSCIHGRPSARNVSRSSSSP
jgi:hypothetical protein